MRYLFILWLGSAFILQAGDGPAAVPASTGADALFGDMPVVETAALHAQTLAEAPASVTVVTAADIRKYGYRTLADVLGATRGFTVSSDHLEVHSGVRGFAVPGDYNTCFLVMINGHPMTEIISDANSFFGQDFGLDLELVERIEIIRGPSSALYGSNGILATINIVTTTPAADSKLLVSTEAGSGGVQKAVVMTSMALGRGANLLIEGSGFFSGGHNLLMPDSPASGPNSGLANGVDAQNGFHSFIDLQWGSWNFTGYFNNQVERAPILGFGTQFNDQGQFIRTSHDFGGASYTRNYAGGGELRWQTYYDRYRFKDRYDYVEDFGILDTRDSVWGDWISSEITYSHPLQHVGLLTVGLSSKLELRNTMENFDHSPDHAVNLDMSHPDRTIAPFVQQEWNLSPQWTAYLGARLDVSGNYGSFVSPRVALVYQPTPRTSFKLVYGRPFRTPSVYEKYFTDGITQFANPALRPETAEAVEFSVERKLGKSSYALVNAYHYSLGSVIEAVWISDAVIQYQNTGARNSNGVDFEIGGHPRTWLETTASLSLDRAVESEAQHALANAPGQIAKFRAAVPLWHERVYFSADLQYLSARWTPTYESTRPVALVNATLSTTKLFRGFNFVAGLRNALNWGYADPIASPLANNIDQMPANGRTAFVKLIWTAGQ